jgi:DNA-binding response OmpR family regulator
MMSRKRIICISWNEALSKSRELLLRSLGVTVLSALYQRQAISACREKADLLVLGHSVPKEEKRSLIRCFREHSDAPVLSLLQTGDRKLPEATFGVESSKPEEVLRAVREILTD